MATRTLLIALVLAVVAVGSQTEAQDGASSDGDAPTVEESRTLDQNKAHVTEVEEDAGAPCPGCGRPKWSKRQAATDDGDSTPPEKGCCRGAASATSEEGVADSRSPGCRRRGKKMPGGQERQAVAGSVGGGRGPASSRRGIHGRNQAEMTAYRALLENLDSLARVVEEVPGGVRTLTTSTDAELVPTLLLHVSQMKALIESGGRIRAWDPQFAEIFDNAGKIQMVIEPVEDGVAVIETSSDEEVVRLIRARAAKVDQFVAHGGDAYQEATALPAGYPTR